MADLGFRHEPSGKNIPPLEMFHYKTFITVCPNRLIFVASSISRTEEEEKRDILITFIQNMEDATVFFMDIILPQQRI